ncbi:unnamed protein product [Candidula unifasciata]|uniref:Major facilitator superfamily (MFS) profile domain-containing protein n=1 Tax=Candidula unifasciata TaxID=100452 RepID=A0A8S4A5I2_9EUPU|nr:unnamed protein product [Candidula unifasciata]
MSTSILPLQLEKRISSDLLNMGGLADGKWEDKHASKNDQSLGLSESDALLKKNGMNGIEKQEGSKGEVNIDRCYSWLTVRVDEAASGKRSRHDSMSSFSSSTSSSLPMPQAPDGGWGWFIVLGAFMVTVICDGLSYCFGVLYTELKVQFGESHSKTSLIGSIFYGVSMILGPFASALTTRFGCRTMTIIGGIISSVGLFLSSFATSIEMLCITFSAIVGTGFSFCYITSVVVVAFYFDKRRALATGLAVCGTGVGTFTFAPLMDYLIVEFGWRGMFIVMAGISLNLIVCGMLFRPLQFTESERWEILLQEFNKIPYSREDIEFLRNRYPSDSSDYHSDEDIFDEEARTLSVLSLPTFVSIEMMRIPSTVLMEALKSSKNPHLTLHRYMKNAMLQIEGSSLFQTSPERIGTSVDIEAYSLTPDSSDSDIPNSLPASILNDCLSHTCAIKSNCLTCQKNEATDAADSYSRESFSKPGQHSPISSSQGKQKTQLYAVVGGGKSYTVPHESHQHERREFSGMSNILTNKGCEKEGRSVVKRLSGVHIGRHNALGIHLPLYRTDIFYRRLLRNNPAHRQCTLGTSCPELSESVAPETSGNIIVKKVKAFFEESYDMMRNMVEFKLFLNPFFLVFVSSNFIFYFWDDIPYMYASDHAQSTGVEQHKASFLISVIGIFNTVGQVVFGFVGDMDINLLSVYAIISSVAGLFVALIPLMKTYVSLAATYSLFGFFISVSFPLTTVLLVNYLGVAKLTSAYGLLMLVQGVANVGGPPFAGWLTDTTGNFDLTFYLCGFFYAVSGLVMFLVYIPKCVKYVKPKRGSMDYTGSVDDV